MKKSIKVTIAVLAAIVIMLVIALFHYREGATDSNGRPTCSFNNASLPFLNDEGFKQIANELRYLFCTTEGKRVIPAFSDLLSWRRAFDCRDVLNTFYWYGWYGNKNKNKKIPGKVNMKVLNALKDNIKIWCNHMDLLREALVADKTNFFDKTLKTENLPRIIIPQDDLSSPEPNICNVYLNEKNEVGQTLNKTWQNYNDEYFNTVYDINLIHSFDDVIKNGTPRNNIEIIMKKLLKAEESILKLINVMPWRYIYDENKQPSKVTGILKEPEGWNPDFTDFIMNKSTFFYFGDLDETQQYMESRKLPRFKNPAQFKNPRLDLAPFIKMKMFLE